MSRTTKRILLCSTFVLGTFFLSGCSASCYGTELSGVSVVFYPFIFLWKWIFYTFSPGFWGFLAKIWTSIPVGIVWIAGPLVYILGLVLFVGIFIIFLAADIILGILTAIAWLFAAIANGIFHFA